MKYVKPEMDIILFEAENVIRTSVTGEEKGSGNENDPNAPDEW